MTQELIDAVNTLTTETASLLTAYTTAKNTIDSKVAQTAEDRVQTGADRAQITIDKAVITADKNAAAGSASDALGYKNLAAEISGLTTVAQAVELALSELHWQAEVLSELTGGMVVNRVDDNGNNNVMLKIPMFTNDTVNSALGTSFDTGPHPAFIDPDGTTLTHFEYAIYAASNDGSGNPVSAPYKDAYTTISFDSAKAKCAAMGAGWHLSSNAEWAAIVLLCLMNGWDPLGNTNYGRSHASLYQTAIRQDGLQPGDASGTARILAGTGPASWRHDGQFGIADLVGNVWEWQDGFKQENGQIIVADKNGMDEADWIAQTAYYNGDNKLANAKTSDGTGISADPWANQQKDENYIANPLLQSLLIEPVDATLGVVGKLYCNNTITGFPRRGGGWSYGSYAGLGALYLSSSRSNARSDVGFRPAFFG